ncbi:hypothetical protein EYC84_003659 [Monilinia fructicola]|uniref:Uncharacterized protein n=1 Tax=Monilinia fructicola TaxID=38448 RepID=A0A5M9JUD8_MONFR|nr:hypothetical protein EYC84_003659 [Monilinia fructicola]
MYQSASLERGERDVKGVAGGTNHERRSLEEAEQNASQLIHRLCDSSTHPSIHSPHDDNHDVYFNIFVTCLHIQPSTHGAMAEATRYGKYMSISASFKISVPSGKEKGIFCEHQWILESADLLGESCWIE